MKTKNKKKDWSIYKQLLKLWSNENPIKTNKLQMLLLVNAILLCAVMLRKGFISGNRPLYLGGAIYCLIWVLSVGRTSFFQKIWQIKINRIASGYPDDARFRIHQYKEETRKLPRFLRIIGGVSSTYYLLGTPIVFCLAWLSIFIISLI